MGLIVHRLDPKVYANKTMLIWTKKFGQPLGSSSSKWAKRHWSIKARGHFWMDHLQAKALQHLKLPKPTLVTMASNRLFWLFGIPNWGWIHPWVPNSIGRERWWPCKVDPWVKHIICERHQGRLGLSPTQYPHQIVNQQIIFLYSMPWTNIKIWIWFIE
jgi:hypothetical protein